MHVPEKLGKYQVNELIGRGSVGNVYRGYDTSQGIHVAVKVATYDAMHDSKFSEYYRKIFFNEAHTAGALKHPYIVEIFDTGIDADYYYIAMELVEGADTLKPYCSPENLLPLEQVVEIIFKCAKALDYAHRHGVVHRDIKPTNILLTKDKDVKIADFSLAQLIDSNTACAMPMGFIGSPRYMSPEQVQEDAISRQTDLFSLGIVMYEMITGKHPFIAESFSRLIHKIINEQQPPLHTYRDGLPEIFEKIVRRALQKDPNKRYKMGLDLAADLSLAFDSLGNPPEDSGIEEKFNQIWDA